MGGKDISLEKMRNNLNEYLQHNFLLNCFRDFNECFQQVKINKNQNNFLLFNLFTFAIFILNIYFSFPILTLLWWCLLEIAFSFLKVNLFYLFKKELI